MGEVIRTAGARAAEARLLAAVEALLGAPDLAQPVRVVVPSASLRLHVAARVAATRGRAAVGVRVQTLDGLTREVLDRAGVAIADPAPFPIRVRREARREPALADGLEPLADGYGAVVGAVDDLLDAGFEAAHAEALDEQLGSQPGPRAPIARARAVVRVAARLAAQIAAGSVSHRCVPLVRARELLERDPTLLPARALLLHGFADATGVQSDLIALLLGLHGARVVLDTPADPTAAGQRPDPRFGAAFRERLGAAGERGARGPADPPARIRLLRAPNRSSEARAVALRLRERLDAGAVPERLAIVARDLAPYRVALRTHLRRLSVPFSGVAEVGAAEPARRRLNALLALLEPSDRPAMEPWTSARLGVPEPARASLRHALHRRGALRLDEVAGLAAAPADAGILLVGAGRAAAALLDRLAARPGRAAVARHAAWLAALAGEDLAWAPGCPERAALDAALAALPAAEPISHDEFLWLLRRALEPAGLAPVGGAGGGVQILSVMEARARSFDALFVLGMSRGAFPRTIREDALLPDAIRTRLREVLPALPVKRDGFDEERFLFAQLVSAAPEVTLSWSETSDDGRPQPKSPLLEAPARGDGGAVHEVAPALHAPGQDGRALPARERALLAGLHGSRADFARAFASALLEQGDEQAAALAGSRLAVLDELDPPLARGALLGPYFGFVGEATDPADPRRAPLYVTRLEAVARCPWQGFLSRVLRLAPPPDAAHELPGANDPRLIGTVVHQVLERIAHAAEPASTDLPALLRDPAPVPWPDEATLAGFTAAAAAACLRDAASPLPEYARVLAERARPFLERARQCDWSAGAPPVVGTEVQAAARVRDAAGREREIGFRADRADRVGGRLLFTDYKTGKPFADQKGAAARDKAFARAIAEGRALQAPLYARGGGADAVGRYVFLREDVPDEARSLSVSGADPLAGVFDTTLRTLLEVWDRGAFVPRLRRADRDEEPGACRFCELKDACLRGDSGARRRLERWLERAGEAGSAPERAAAAGLAMGMETP
jgi:RecB family exonuclease